MIANLHLMEGFKEIR